MRYVEEESRDDKDIIYKIKKGRLIGLGPSGIGNAHKNTLLKERWRKG